MRIIQGWIPRTGLINQLHLHAKFMSPALLAGLTAGQTSPRGCMRPVLAIFVQEGEWVRLAVLMGV
jgi:hypothetical protein